MAPKKAAGKPVGKKPAPPAKGAAKSAAAKNYDKQLPPKKGKK